MDVDPIEVGTKTSTCCGSDEQVKAQQTHMASARQPRAISNLSEGEILVVDFQWKFSTD